MKNYLLFSLLFLTIMCCKEEEKVEEIPHQGDLFSYSTAIISHKSKNQIIVNDEVWSSAYNTLKLDADKKLNLEMNVDNDIQSSFIKESLKFFALPLKEGKYLIDNQNNPNLKASFTLSLDGKAFNTFKPIPNDTTNSIEIVAIDTIDRDIWGKYKLKLVNENDTIWLKKGKFQIGY